MLHGQQNADYSALVLNFSNVASTTYVGAWLACGHTVMTQLEKTLDRSSGTWNVLGVLIEFLAGPSNTQSDTALIRATIRAGLVIPLHSHIDQELIYVVDGDLEVFLETHGWRSVVAGQAVVIPSNKKHALRNAAAGDATIIAFTGASLYSFFRDLAVPADPNAYPVMVPPTSEQMKHLFEISAEYGYSLEGIEENAAIGIRLPV